MKPTIRRWLALVTAAFVVVSLSFSAQAAEKKKIMGTNKLLPPISRTVVPPVPGDDPKHELVALMIRRDTTTSSDPDWNETEVIHYEQDDQVAGTGTHKGGLCRVIVAFEPLKPQGEDRFGTLDLAIVLRAIECDQIGCPGTEHLHGLHNAFA